MREFKVNVEGMHCKPCVTRIFDSISDLAGISDVLVDFEKKQVIFSCSSEKLVEAVKYAIRKEGYAVH